MKRLLLLPALFFALVAHAQTPTLKVIDSTPANGATSVSTAGAIDVSFTFNEPLESLSHALDLVTLVGGGDIDDLEASLSADKKTLTFELAHRADTDYLWIVSGSYLVDPECAEDQGAQTEIVSMQEPYILHYTTSGSMGVYTVSGTVDASGASAAKTALSVGTLNLGKIYTLSPRKATPQVSTSSTATPQASVGMALPLARQTRLSTSAAEVGGSLVLLVHTDNPNPDLEENARIAGAAVVGADGSYTVSHVHPGSYLAVAMSDFQFGKALDLSLIGLIDQFLIGTYDDNDPDPDPNVINITSGSLSGIDITMRPVSSYAVTMEEAEADAQDLAETLTSESNLTLLGASSFLMDSDGKSPFWTFDYAVPPTEEDLITVARLAFLTYSDGATSDASDFDPFPASYKTPAEVLTALNADSRVQAFMSTLGAKKTTIAVLGGDAYLYGDPFAMAHADKNLWQVTILALGNALDLYSSVALSGYVDAETGAIVDVLTFPNEPFAYTSTTRAAANVVLESASPTSLFHVFAYDVDPSTGKAQAWSHDYFADPTEIFAARVTMSGVISLAYPIFTNGLPAGVATVPANPAPLADALALADEKVGDEVRAKLGNNYVISVEGGYAQFLLASDTNILNDLPNLASTPVWVISYETLVFDETDCSFEDTVTAAVIIDMETGAYIKELGYSIPIPNEPDDDIAFDTGLGAGFPNPFATEATIPFSLVSASNVSLKVYDVLGREVATLVDGLVPAGKQTARWNATGHPSGVYFVRLTVDGATYTQKIVLRK